MQKSTLIGTCSLWSQWLGPVASEAEPGFGVSPGEEIQYIEIHSSVERGTGPKWVERSRVPSASIAPSQPQMIWYIPLTQPQADGCKFCRGL